MPMIVDEKHQCRTNDNAIAEAKTETGRDAQPHACKSN